MSQTEHDYYFSYKKIKLVIKSETQEKKTLKVIESKIKYKKKRMNFKLLL